MYKLTIFLLLFGFFKSKDVHAKKNSELKERKYSADKLTQGADDTLNVKSYGAKGDSAHNDSAAFQQALNYSSKNRKVLFVPAGVYLINNLIIPQDAKIVGAGSNVSILRLSSGTVNNRQCIVLSGSNNSMFKNLCFDANNVNNTGKNIFCVKTQLKKNETLSDVVFNHCTFCNSKNYGALFLIGGLGIVDHVIVENCNFINLGSCAVSLRGVNHLTFTNNTVANWGLTDDKCPAFNFESDECSDLLFSYNTFLNKSASHFAIECAGTYVTRGRFLNNTFNGNGYDASGISGYFRNCIFDHNRHLKGGGSHRSGYELVGDYDTVSNNYIEHGAISLGTSPQNKFTSTGGLNYIVKSNKVISSFGINNICLSIGGTETVRNAIIEDNFFDNSNGKGNAPVINLGQRGGMDGVVITNNKLIGATKNACIKMQATNSNSTFYSNITIENNIFSGGYGIQIVNMPSWKSVKINDNDFSNLNDLTYFKTSDFTGEFKMNRNKMAAGR